MFRVILLISVWTLFLSCKNEVKKDMVSEEIKFGKIVELRWLEGNWTNINDESQSYESWTKLNDSTLLSFSYVLVEKDTVFSEVVTVQERFNDVFLTAKVPDQNDSEAISFKMISSTDGIYTFENKEHDFPTRITYTNPVKDSIHAWIEGIVDDKDRKVDFYFEREN